MSQAATLQKFAACPAEFRDSLLIDVADGATRLGSVLDDWQRHDFEAMDPAWQRAAGYPVEGGLSRGWLERPRGHSKTQDIAVMSVWCLAFCKRRIRGIVAAADKDQAKLLVDAIRRIVSLNPWLTGALKVHGYHVNAPRTGSSLQVLSSAEHTSYGELPDFTVCDELCHWRSSGLWESLFSASAKRPNALLMAISNAGFIETWQFPIREAVASDESWYFSRLDGPVASWISPHTLAEQKRLLPDQTYRRLWLNEWSSGSGDALDEGDIEAAVTLGGETGPQGGHCYGIGLDLGLRRDHSGMVVVGVSLEDRRIHVARCRSWRPIGGQVNLAAVEREVSEACRAYRTGVIYDPWQAEYLGQRLRSQRIPAQQWPFSAVNMKRMATALLETFRNRRIDLYDHTELIEGLRRISITERSDGSGYRLTAPRGKDGHCDVAMAMAICLPQVVEFAAAGVDRVRAQQEYARNSPFGGRRVVSTKQFLAWHEWSRKGGSVRDFRKFYG